MDISIKRDGDKRYIVSIPGQSEWRDRLDLVDALRAHAQSTEIEQVIVDLQGVSFINSAALGEIFALRNYVRPFGGQIVVCRPSVVVRRLLETINLPRLIPVAASLEEARAALAQPVVTNP